MRGLRAALAFVLAAATLAACATTPPPHRSGPPAHRPPQPQRPPPSEAEPGESGLPGAPVAFASLKGWDAEDHASAFRAFQQGCGPARDAPSLRLCRLARAAGPLDERRARAFFETYFQPTPLEGQGLMTAYFQPEYEARAEPEGEFTAPVRARPSETRAAARAPAAPVPGDQLGQELQGLLSEPQPVADPYADREMIERAPLDEPALAWMRPEDLFFMQIQGSGVLDLPGGRRLRASFAASNGKPFVGLARVMREQGLLADKETSQAAIHAWLAAHHGPQADDLMRKNPRYVFFKVAPDDGQQPAGAAGVPLPAGRALAVDASRHGMGELYWIDASAPALTGAFPAYRRLAVALDVGGAIKGEVRADLYIGRGEEAGREAGRVRHALRMYRLVPRGDAQALASAGS